MKSLIPETRVAWLRINTQVRETTPFKVSMSQLFLQDYTMINLDDFTELENEEVFGLEEQSKQPYEKDT